LIGWWARQDSNLQPDRYGRSEYPEYLSIFNKARAFLRAFVRVCSRVSVGFLVGVFFSLRLRPH